jgi:hypothetical protein
MKKDREWLLCDKCGDYILIDDIFEPLYTTTICKRCLHFPDLLGPDEDIEWRMYGNSNTYFGVELEFYGDREAEFSLENKSKYLEYKCEESVLSGFEVVTHPASYELHKNVISKLFKHRIYNAKNTDRTAMHVHINIDSPLFMGDTSYVIGKLNYFLYLHHEKLCNIFGRSKKDYESFCSLVPDGFEDATYANFKYSAQRISDEMKKTYAVLMHKHTVEFRMFNTTNNSKKYMDNINIVIALIKVATDIDVKRYNDFSIFETMLYNTRSWLNDTVV